MARNRSNTTAILVVLALILGVLLVFLAAGGVWVWMAMEDARFRRDLNRIKQIDRVIDDEIYDHPEGDSAYRKRVDALIIEQNALVTKWQSRLPDRVPQKTLEEGDKMLGKD